MISLSVWHHETRHRGMRVQAARHPPVGPTHSQKKFLSKLNQRIFESGMGVGAPRGMVEEPDRALDGLSRARYCNWTALALDPTPIQMSIDPELAAQGQNPHGLLAASCHRLSLPPRSYRSRWKNDGT